MDESFSYCSLPQMPPRELPAGTDPARVEAILVNESKWVNHTVLHYYFFDRETGLLLRKQTLTDTVLNPIPEQIDFEDYRDVDGVKLPFLVRVSNIDTYYSYTRKVAEVRHNVPVDDKIFDMPQAAPQP